MSLKVLVIPEDPTNNGYILKPLVSKLLDLCGKPHAKVSVLTNPKADGYDHAKKLLRTQVLDRYAHMDLLLFLPDSDGQDKQPEFDELERVAREKSISLLCCAANPEVEIWLLAGHIDKLDFKWDELRKHHRLKEDVFNPFLEKNGDHRRAGGGRDLLMMETLKNIDGLLGRCNELAKLMDRIKSAALG